MTPAEKASAKKQKQKRKPGKSPTRKIVWVCRCREYRDKHGLTLRDVQDDTGINNATICQIEHGQETTLTTAFRIAEFYGVPINVLWPHLKGKE